MKQDKLEPNSPIWIIKGRNYKPCKIPGIFHGMRNNPYSDTQHICEVFGIPCPNNPHGFWYMLRDDYIPRNEPDASLDELQKITGFRPGVIHVRI